MKTGRLPVALPLASHFEAAPKPPGFDVIWERYIQDNYGNPGVEYFVAGPFPEEIEDGARVGLELSQPGPGLIAFRWIDDRGKPVGDEVVVAWT